MNRTDNEKLIVNVFRDLSLDQLKKKTAGHFRVAGWVKTLRKLGAITFVVIYDFFGEIQLVFSRKTLPSISISLEDLLVVDGKVKAKLPSLTSKVKKENEEKEISVTKVIYHFPSQKELLRYKEQLVEADKYTDYLAYLCRRELKETLIFKSKLIHLWRNHLIKKGFIDIETPILTRVSPEGAENFLVFGKQGVNKFFALSQSPQIFKQLLMTARFDRYFQFAKCFRNEPLRSDRQPEFIQLDLELSFATINQVIDLIETMLFESLIQMDFSAAEISFDRCSFIEFESKQESQKNSLKSLKFLWVVGLPLFKIEKSTGKLVSFHHPFVKAAEKKLSNLTSSSFGQSFDLYLNGVEIASGSERIYRLTEQLKVFELLGYSSAEIKKDFAYFFAAFSYAMPPHAGIGFGVDRFVAQVLKKKNIRDVIAFPKDSQGRCYLTSAPSKVKSNDKILVVSERIEESSKKGKEIKKKRDESKKEQ